MPDISGLKVASHNATTRHLSIGSGQEHDRSAGLK